MNLFLTTIAPYLYYQFCQKYLKKVAFKQFYNYLNDNKLIYASQHGFRKSHSTETASYEFVERVNNTLDNNHLPLTIFIDLSKAFDTLDHTILVNKLEFYGVKDSSLLWFQNYLSGSYQRVTYDGCTSDSLSLTTGVPQGSI